MASTRMTVEMATAVAGCVLALFALLALAGHRREFMELRARLEAGVEMRATLQSDGPLLNRLHGRGGFVLKIDPKCISCRPTIDVFKECAAAYPDEIFVLLAPSGTDGQEGRLTRGATEIGVVMDDASFSDLRCAWVPALLRLDRFGRIVDGIPAADAGPMAEFVRTMSLERKSAT